MRKQNIFILCVILIILLLLIGYVIYSTDYDVKKSKVSNIDVDFIHVGKIKEVGSTGASAKISHDRNYLTINVPNLLYKGAYVVVPITIKNVGLVSAKLVWINEYGFSSNSPITVEYGGLGLYDIPLEPGDTSNMFVKITWNKDINMSEQSTNFMIRLYYEQARRKSKND